jgi:integrase
VALFRKTVTRPMPAGATIRPRTSGGKTELWASWTAGGKKRTALVVAGADGSQRVRTTASTWTARYRDGDGVVREVATGCKDAEAARQRLAELVRTAERVRAGVLSRADADVAQWQSVPLERHISDYVGDLASRGVNRDRIKTTAKYLSDDAAGCGFRWLGDLNADRLRRWLRSLEVSAATYNWHAEVWTAFGWWLAGRRVDGKRWSRTGDLRLGANPFENFGKRDVACDRRREARALTVAELRRLLVHARCRPLDEALTVHRGVHAGLKRARLSDERRSELERLGAERALIYKSLALTGLRLNELRTLRVGDLSFGDVPFVALRAANEKNRRGSTVPLRGDLAAELRDWVTGRPASDRVFTVPMGLLRILNRDLAAAGIPKVDEQGRRVHLHAMRHSTGTHLSAAGVSPRTAQAVMRHSDIQLTMRTYTDERLLDAAGAVELLPDLGPAGWGGEKTVAPLVALPAGISGQNGAVSGTADRRERPLGEAENRGKLKENRGLSKSGRLDSNQRPLRPERSALPRKTPKKQGKTRRGRDGCTAGCTADNELEGVESVLEAVAGMGPDALRALRRLVERLEGR